MIYLFFLVHMLVFGGSGFFIAYSDLNTDVGFLYMHGGIAIFVYTIFYLVFFGLARYIQSNRLDIIFIRQKGR